MAKPWLLPVSLGPLLLPKSQVQELGQAGLQPQMLGCWGKGCLGSLWVWWDKLLLSTTSLQHPLPVIVAWY